MTGVAGAAVGGTIISATGLPPELTATDLDVRDSFTDYPGGGGGAAFWDTRASLTRVRMENVVTGGIGVYSPRAELVATDVLIRNVQPQRTGSPFGLGVDVGLGSRADLRDIQIEGATGVGMLARRTSSVMIDGLVVRDLRPVQGTSRGIEVSNGALLDLRRAEITRAGELGIIAAGEGSRVTGNDLVIVDTDGLDCPGCDAAGIGAGAFAGGAIDLSDFVVTRSALCGVQVADAELDLRDGEVSYGPIGANVATEGYDLDRITRDVIYIGNGVNLDTASLPVPDSTEGVGLSPPAAPETM
jgi:hypothetical protein